MTAHAARSESGTAVSYPSAAERDALKRATLAQDDTLYSTEFDFVTGSLSVAERAAVVAALTALRAEETQKVKRVARIAREPWRRSQRAQRRIEEFFEGA